MVKQSECERVLLRKCSVNLYVNIVIIRCWVVPTLGGSTDRRCHMGFKIRFHILKW